MVGVWAGEGVWLLNVGGRCQRIIMIDKRLPTATSPDAAAVHWCRSQFTRHLSRTFSLSDQSPIATGRPPYLGQGGSSDLQKFDEFEGNEHGRSQESLFGEHSWPLNGRCYPPEQIPWQKNEEIWRKLKNCILGASGGYYPVCPSMWLYGYGSEWNVGASARCRLCMHTPCAHPIPSKPSYATVSDRCNDRCQLLAFINCECSLPGLFDIHLITRYGAYKRWGVTFYKRYKYGKFVHV